MSKKITSVKSALTEEKKEAPRNKNAPSGTMTCICGSVIVRRNLTTHEKTLKHRRALGLIEVEQKSKKADRNAPPRSVDDEETDEDSIDEYDEEDDLAFQEQQALLVKNVGEMREDIWDIQEAIDNLVELISQSMMAAQMDMEEDEEDEEDEEKSNTNTLETVEDDEEEEEEDEEEKKEQPVPKPEPEPKQEPKPEPEPKQEGEANSVQSGAKPAEIFD